MGNAISPRTTALYGYWLGRFRDYLEGRPASVAEAEAWLASLEGAGLSSNTRGIAARALRHEGLPVSAPPVQVGEPDYLDVDQVRALVGAARSVLDRTLVTVLFSSACRISEVLNLRVGDLELDRQVATVTRKGGRRERVTLGRQGAEALREWLACRRSRSRWVFMDYTYHDAWRLLKETAARAGIPDFHPHLLRHSRLMHLRKAGRDWGDIAEVAGHQRVETTIRMYGRRKAEERHELLVDW